MRVKSPDVSTAGVSVFDEAMGLPFKNVNNGLLNKKETIKLFSFYVANIDYI